MQSLAKTLRSRQFVLAVHICLWVLLYFAVRSLGWRTPAYHESENDSAAVQSPAPVAKLDQLFAATNWVRVSLDSNAMNSFFTRHFIPAPAPVVAAPTTRKIEMTYHGFYEAGPGPRRAVLKVGDNFVIARLGSNVTANLYLAHATMQMVTLTNPAAQTNLLPLNAKREVEVPIK